MDCMSFVTICDSFFDSHEVAEYRARNGYEKVYEKARQQISDVGQVLSAVIYLRKSL